MILASILFGIAILVVIIGTFWGFGATMWVNRQKFLADTKVFGPSFKYLQSGNYKASMFLMDVAVPELYKLMDMTNPLDWYRNWNWEPPKPPLDEAVIDVGPDKAPN